jgi:hypothetical protein
MVLQGDGAQVKARFSPFVDSANLDTRLVHGLHRTYQRLRINFRRIGWYSYVTRPKWKLDSVRLEIVLILMQDRCTLCAELTIDSEIILDAPDVTPR